MTSVESSPNPRVPAGGHGAGPCYVYGVTRAATTLPAGLEGVDGRGVGLVVYGDVAAVVGRVDPDRALVRRADVLSHSRVLDAVAARGPVIPARFGSVLADPAAVVDELLASGDEYFLRLLDDLTGRQQFTLRGRYAEDVVLTEVVTENPEIAALRERTRGKPEAVEYAARVRLGELVARAVEAKRAADAEAIVSTLAPHSVSYNVRDGGELEHLVDVAFLVDVEHREAFESAAEEAASLMGSRARLQLLGPLAPYDFVPEE